MAQRRIAIEFDATATQARALARAVYFMTTAADIEEGGFVVCDGFSMNASDGWTGDYRISVEKR